MTTGRNPRQAVLLFLLAVALIAGGIVVLLFLKQIPPLMRFAVGMFDLAAGSTLLLALRQRGRSDT
jgi:hypothetical protein